MNIAFTTLVIFILLLPGIFFSRFYYSGEFSKEYFKPNLFELILSTLIQSLFLHSIGLWIAHTLMNYDINAYITLSIVMGVESTEELQRIAASIEANFGKIVLYNFFLWFGAAVLGWLSRVFVRKMKLDRRFSLLRYQNDWHYLISGEILDFPNVPGEKEEVNLILVDVLVSSEVGSIVYSGALFNYILSKEGGIKSVYLSNVKRRLLKNIGEEEVLPPRQEIPGKILVIPYDQIENMNITYYSVDDLSDHGEPEEASSA